MDSILCGLAQIPNFSALQGHNKWCQSTKILIFRFFKQPLSLDTRKVFGLVDLTVGSFSQRYRFATGSLTTATVATADIPSSCRNDFQRSTLQLRGRSPSVFPESGPFSQTLPEQRPTHAI